MYVNFKISDHTSAAPPQVDTHPATKNHMGPQPGPEPSLQMPFDVAEFVSDPL